MKPACLPLTGKRRSVKSTFIATSVYAIVESDAFVKCGFPTVASSECFEFKHG